ncbi:MAG: type I secretion system permease/ATPase [Brevundimonas sp.]|uniref:type I secretion system permease/ATPase n=1 Tax=Brevundimonas sp. TaxID=1871086 RepID=UPI00391C4429
MSRAPVPRRQKSLPATPLDEAIRSCRPYLRWAIFFSALVNLLFLTPTLYMMQVYDRVVPTAGLGTLGLLTGIAVFALACLAVLDWLRGRILFRASIKLERLLSQPILERVIVARTERRPTEAGLRELDQVRACISGPGALALLDAPWTPLYLLVCFMLHPAIGLLTLVGGSGLILLALANERENRERLARSINNNAAAYAAQDGIAARAEVVRALGMVAVTVRRQLMQRQNAVRQSAVAQLTAGVYSGWIRFVRLALQAASLCLAAYLVVKGQISPGAIIASSILLSRAVAPVEQLVGNWTALVQARTSWNALSDLFGNVGTENPHRTGLPRPEGRLQLRGVSLRVADSQPPQLRNLNLVINPGEVVGVTGDSGSGKTSLARVASGGIAPTIGEIRLGGAEYRARDGDELAKFIGYLPQVPTLFPGTIRDNISRFAIAGAVTNAEIDQGVIDASIAAGCHEMILKLPNAYDTVLGLGGSGVSVGQSQRIALARALYGAPALLVLDEPNANLDREGETALRTCLTKASGRGCAILLVAHTSRVLALADRIVVMKDGAIHSSEPRAKSLLGEPAPDDRTVSRSWEAAE